jgi:hypothetical protein
MEQKSIGFNYGVMSDPLEQQAREQGYSLKNSELYEKLKDAINLLTFHLTTDSQTDKMFQKLHKKVVKDLEEIKK